MWWPTPNRKAPRCSCRCAVLMGYSLSSWEWGRAGTGGPWPPDGLQLGDGNLGGLDERDDIRAHDEGQVVHRAGGDDRGDDAPRGLDIDLGDDVAPDDFTHLALELVTHVDGLDGHGFLLESPLKKGLIRWPSAARGRLHRARGRWGSRARRRAFAARGRGCVYPRRQRRRRRAHVGAADQWSGPGQSAHPRSARRGRPGPRPPARRA